MKRAFIIAISLLSMASCTKTTTGIPAQAPVDTTSNGSSFSIQYDSLSYSSKDAMLGTTHLVTLTSATDSIDSVHNVITISLHSRYGIYDIPVVDFYLLGTGNHTGTFTFGSVGSWFKAGSEIGLDVPGVVFSDTSGTAIVTYNGSDYIEGTFTTTIYADSVSHYATGSFKIYY